MTPPREVPVLTVVLAEHPSPIAQSTNARVGLPHCRYFVPATSPDKRLSPVALVITGCLPQFQHLSNRIAPNIVTAIDNEDFGRAITVRVRRPLIFTG